MAETPYPSPTGNELQQAPRTPDAESSGWGVSDEHGESVTLVAEQWPMPNEEASSPARGRVITYPDRASWLEARRQGIGASDAAAILGLSPWTSAFGLYCEKLGLRQRNPAETEAMAWGQALEPFVAARYTEQTSRSLHDLGRFAIRYANDPPWMHATLDREIRGDERGPGVLEIKTATAFKADEWADEAAPIPYLVQLQHQLAVTGFAWGALAVLIGGQRLKMLDVERNDRFIARLLEVEADFWDRLQRQDPPAVDASEATADVLSEVFPRDDGRVIALPDDAIEWDRLRLEAEEAIEKAKRQKTEAENKLKAALGTATKGIVASGIAYSWKTQTRKSYHVAAASFRVLRRVKP